MTLRLGMIGLSDGNGHPYSWSAIINGYNPAEMENCGFDVIPRYLERQRWPEDRIVGALVTHIWTQERDLSSHIARATGIANVLTDLGEMIGEVDGVLLARDDAENHVKFAAPFLDAGLPVFIDKPIAHTLKDFERISSLQKYPGQIFTCSATRYSRNMELGFSDSVRLGQILEVNGVVPKSWERYSIHIIEPTLKLVSSRGHALGRPSIVSYGRFEKAIAVV